MKPNVALGKDNLALISFYCEGIIREYNLETYFLFLDYEKAFEEVRRPLVLSISQAWKKS